jgi:hypothetical protein
MSLCYMYVLYKLIIKKLAHILKQNKIRSQKLMSTNMDSTIAGGKLTSVY